MQYQSVKLSNFQLDKPMSAISLAGYGLIQAIDGVMVE